MSSTEIPPVVAPRTPRLWFIDDFLDGDGPWLARLRRVFVRTSSTLFADIGSDFFLWYRVFWVRKQLRRIALAAVILGASYALNGIGWASSLALIPFFAAVVYSPAFAVAVSTVLAFFTDPAWWFPFVATLTGALYGRTIEPAWEVAAALGDSQAISLIPLPESLLLATRRLRFTVASALDLAVAGFPERAAVNVEAALPRLGRRTPDALAMLTVAQAMIAYEQRGHREALEQIERARQLSERASPAPRAWILLRLAQLLAALGDEGAARAFTAEAVRIVPRRAKSLEIEARLQYGRYLGTVGDDAAQLRSLHRARLLSLRQRDVLGLMSTELALLEARDEPLEVQEEVLSFLVDFARMEYKNAAPIPADVAGSIEALAGEIAVMRGEQRDAADHYAHAVQAFQGRNPVQQGLVLARFAELLSVRGKEPLADGITWEEQRENAYGAALDAVRELNDVRYALPTVQWRQRWTLARSQVYDFALRLALEDQRFTLAASLIELSKSQAVPLSHDARSSAQRALLDSLLETRSRLIATDAHSSATSRADAAVATLLSSHPVGAGLTPIVAGKKLLEEVPDEGLDVDATIEAVGGKSAYYLTGVVTGKDYYWAYRTAHGRWLAGHVDVGPNTEAGRALEDLFSALPVRMASEDDLAYALRLSRSPLFLRSTPDVRATTSALLQVAGRVLVPTELAAELRRTASSGEERPTLLVSLPGVLASVPAAFLGVADRDDASDDERLIEIANVSFLPSLQLAAQIAHRPHTYADRWPVRVAGAFPMPGAEHVAAPPSADAVIDTRVPPERRKTALREALAALETEAATVYLSGHLLPAEQRGSGDPLETGLQLATGDSGSESYLTVDDMLKRSSGKAFVLPQRVLLLACSTAGVVDDRDDVARSAEARWPQSGEWTGFGAACLLAGARTVVCTHFDQLDSAETTALDHHVTQMLEHVDGPVHGLGAIQRHSLAAWRTEDGSVPAIVPMAYAIVSCRSEGYEPGGVRLAETSSSTASTKRSSGSPARTSTFRSRPSTTTYNVTASPLSPGITFRTTRRQNSTISSRATRS